MGSLPVHQVLHGPFHFLCGAAEIEELLSREERTPPAPQQVFPEDEMAAPFYAFPVLQSAGSQALGEALEAYVAAEERAQLALAKRQPYDHKAHGAAWERYRTGLAAAMENAVISSYGRSYPEIFWLYHSAAVARALKETPKRILRLDLAFGRDHADALKYRVFARLGERLRAVTEDAVNRLAAKTDERREDLFPALLPRMLDNVLALTEDYVGFDLAEIHSFFTGYVQTDGREFRRRLDLLLRWHQDEVRHNRALRHAVRHLLGGRPDGDPRDLLRRRGYVSFLATLDSYREQELLPAAGVELWENLLLRLKEFEVLVALRRLVVPVRRKGAAFLCRPRSLPRRGDSPEILLSPATQVLDFMAQGVVDPQVRRFGLIYDISGFSEILSQMRRAPRSAQESAFRMIFRYQRRVNRLAVLHRLRLEKHLGDGAFYSGRNPRSLLVVAVLLQRAYAEALREGFPFDRGLRIALNFGQYRMVPMEGGQLGRRERYEFFGPGIVELTRLVTGKAMREVDEMKTLLVGLGYPQGSVERFFEPLTSTNLDVVEKQEEERPFHAYINKNGTLVNEGMVATKEFLVELEGHLGAAPLQHIRDGARAYVVAAVEDAGDSALVGIRKLGSAAFKGLDPLSIYEVVDGQRWTSASLEPLEDRRLLTAVERLFGSTRTGREEAAPVPSPAPLPARGRPLEEA